MMVRPKKAPSYKRPPNQPAPMPQMQRFTFPAPTRGWVLNENIMTPGPAGARVLDNWICTPTSIKARGGAAKHATVASAAPVVSMFTYSSGGVETFFGASATAVYNITSPADPDVIPAPAIDGQTSGYYSTVQFGTAGGDYLYAVNGDDLAWLFDGTDWNPVNAAAVNEISYDALTAAFTAGETLTGGTSGATATILAVIPATSTTGVIKLGAITGGPYQDNEALTSAGGAATANGASAAASSFAITGVTTSSLSQVWSFANRIWFVEKNTKSAWYLPVDSISGAATEFSLAGVFQKGGSLVFGASWSMDAGDGLDDKCVFVSDQGEVVVYQGSDPSSSSTWGKVGNYEISPPLGKNAYVKAGGDLLIATQVGLVPVSEAIRRDIAALSLGAVSRAIEPRWQSQAKILTTLPWEIAKWPSEGIMVVTQPETTSTGGEMLVANLQTGAWSRFTGLDGRCLGYYSDTLYYGDLSGGVYEMQSGGQDDTSPYTCVYLGQHEHMGVPISQKTIHQMRAAFLSGTPILPKLTAKVNFSETLSSAPSAATYSATDGWDVSVWDTSLWDASVGASVSAEDSRWVAIGRTGYVAAPELQLTFGSAALPDTELVGIDVMFSVGAPVA